MKTEIYLNGLLVITFKEDKNFNLYDKANILTTDCFVVSINTNPSGNDYVKSVYFKSQKTMQDYEVQQDLTDIEFKSIGLVNNNIIDNIE